MLMLCLEWWTFEIGGFLVGMISEVELGAQSVVYQMVTVAFMVIMPQFILFNKCIYSYTHFQTFPTYFFFHF